MPYTHHRVRKDSTHAPAVALFKRYGYSVADVAEVKGFVDLVVAKHKITVLVEMKRPGGKLRDKKKGRVRDRGKSDQVEFHQTWKGHIVVADSAADAVLACERIIHPKKES
jgi:hypothetical protein